MSRAGGAIGVGAIIGVLLHAGVAVAQEPCVGDCNRTFQVGVDELVIGVGIALGIEAVSACPAFANEEGAVDIVQLLRAVRAALLGCLLPPPTDSTMTTLTPTVTPTVTPTFTPTPPATSTVPANVCLFRQGRCVGGDNDGGECSLHAACPGGRCDISGASRVETNVAALENPLAFGVRGHIVLEAPSPPGPGARAARCRLGEFRPVNIPCIGFLCYVDTAEPCPSGPVDCEGGSPLGLDHLVEAGLGPCADNPSCARACEAQCLDGGRTRVTSGCSGYCSGDDATACTSEVECAEMQLGGCQGPEPVGMNGGVCQCECLDMAAGPPGRPGELQCTLGIAFGIERSAPCDATDVDIPLGSLCIPLTTARSSASIIHANFNPEFCLSGAPCMVPVSGPALNDGSPLECARYDAGTLSGLGLVGAATSLGTALGDVVSELIVRCQ